MTLDDATVEAIAADTPEHIWETAGGYEYTDQIAVALDRHWRKQSVGGVMVSRLELCWLLEGYARARRDPRPTEAEVRAEMHRRGYQRVNAMLVDSVLRDLDCFRPADDGGDR